MDNTTDLSQYYTIEDLEHVKIFETDKTGQKRFITLKELTNSQFELWLQRRFLHLLHPDLQEHIGQVWNYHDRVWALNTMNVVLNRLCVEFNN